MKGFLPAIVLLLPCVANAYFYTGNDLVTAMLEHEKMQSQTGEAGLYLAGIYSGYILAMNDTLEDRGYVCTSERNPNLRQVVAVVTKYIKDNPSRWDEPANLLVLSALLEAFPCPLDKPSVN